MLIYMLVSILKSYTSFKSNFNILTFNNLYFIINLPLFYFTIAKIRQTGIQQKEQMLQL